MYTEVVIFLWATRLFSTVLEKKKEYGGFTCQTILKPCRYKVSTCDPVITIPCSLLSWNKIQHSNMHGMYISVDSRLIGQVLAWLIVFTWLLSECCCGIERIHPSDKKGFTQEVAHIPFLGPHTMAWLACPPNSSNPTPVAVCITYVCHHLAVHLNFKYKLFGKGNIQVSTSWSIFLCGCIFKKACGVAV